MLMDLQRKSTIDWQVKSKLESAHRPVLTRVIAILCFYLMHDIHMYEIEVSFDKKILKKLVPKACLNGLILLAA